MSNKSARPGTKVKLDQPKQVRQIDEIRKEYDLLRAQAGDVQYQLFVLTEELKRLNLNMVQANQEAAERNRIDAEVQKIKETQGV